MLNFIKSSILIFSFSSFASLEDSLKIKSSNYKLLNDHYQKLLSSLDLSNSKNFCKQVQIIYPKLTEIFNDDLSLISELRKSTDSDFREYAAQLEENSYSPFFAYNAYQDVCSQNDFDFSTLKVGVRNHIINVEYLSLLHEQWREAYGQSTF